MCAAVFAALDEGCITETTRHGTGVDYWVDWRRALLEVSGIGPDAAGGLAARHRHKVQQLRAARPHREEGFPGYVFVVHFREREATLSYHTATGDDDG